VLLVPSLGHLSPSFAFLLLEGLAVLGGLGTITARSPVYSAIWFASALLAIGAILLLSGAQFLGMATVAVYAGAIVVTFLFVLMLAQPEGNAICDRLGWGWFPTLCATLAGTSMAGVVIVGILSGLHSGAPTLADQLHAAVTEAISATMAAAEEVADSDENRDPAAVLRNVQLTTDASGAAVLEVDLAAGSSLLSRGEARISQAIRQKAGPELLPPSCRIAIVEKDILTNDHVAHLGKELFGRHLISIEVTGLLLLVALVGAIAMAIHGNELKVDVPEEGVSLR
jgi:NADH-quinone oxidoreductase subunit J